MDIIEYDLSVRVHPFMGGQHRVYRFIKNGRGASVIPVLGSGLVPLDGVWEVAVLDSEGDLDYSTPVTSDVVRVSEDELPEILRQISELPEDTRALTR